MKEVWDDKKVLKVQKLDTKVLYDEIVILDISENRKVDTIFQVNILSNRVEDNLVVDNTTIENFTSVLENEIVNIVLINLKENDLKVQDKNEKVEISVKIA